jgi:nitrous oxidase accessory protein NosD
MTKTVSSVVQLAAALACALPAALPAYAAGANRTFVSALGSDSNPCSLTQPCRTMQAAFNAAAVGGEIEVLDPTGYGALTITHSITIEGHGWASMNTGANGNVITVSASMSDTITLRGLIVEGFGVAARGITINGAGRFVLQDSMIRNFAVRGISIVPADIMTLLISNTTVSNVTAGEGIAMDASNLTINGSLDHVLVVAAGTGADLEASSSGNLNLTLKDCVFSGSGNGVLIAAGGSQVNVMADHSVFANNSTGVHVTSGATVRLTRSILTGNTNAIVTDSGNGSSVLSYGDNSLDGNAAPPPTLPLISLR